MIQKLSRFRNYRDSETIAIQKLSRFRNYDSATTIQKLSRLRNYRNSETTTPMELHIDLSCPQGSDDIQIPTPIPEHPHLKKINRTWFFQSPLENAQISIEFCFFQSQNSSEISIEKKENSIEISSENSIEKFGFWSKFIIFHAASLKHIFMPSCISCTCAFCFLGGAVQPMLGLSSPWAVPLQ